MSDRIDLLLQIAALEDLKRKLDWSPTAPLDPDVDIGLFGELVSDVVHRQDALGSRLIRDHRLNLTLRYQGGKVGFIVNELAPPDGELP